MYSRLLETLTPEAVSALPVGSGDEQAIAFSPSEGKLVRSRSSDAPRVKAGTYYAADYGQISDTLAVSHLAVQAAIDAAYAAGGGEVVLPVGLILLGQAGIQDDIPYALIPRPGVTVRGTMPNAAIAIPPIWDNGFNLVSGSILSFPSGYVFKQDTSFAYNAQTPLCSFNLHNFGVKNSVGILHSGARSKYGWTGSEMSGVYGENITGCAFDLTNPFHIKISVYLARARIGLRLTGHFRNGDGVTMQCGNLILDDFFLFQQDDCQDYNGIEILGAAGNEFPFGGIYGRRVQVNRFFTTPAGTKTGHHMYINGGGQSIPGLLFEDLDLEGFADSAVFMSGVYRSEFRINQAPQTSQINKTIWVENSLDNYVSSQDANVSIECDSGATAGRTNIRGVFARNGTSNTRCVGTYYDHANSGYLTQQFAQYDPAKLVFQTYYVVSTTRFDLRGGGSGGGGIQTGCWDYSDDGGTIWGNYCSGSVNFTSTSDQTKALPAAASYPGEQLYIRKTGATGVTTITGARGGNVTINNQWSSVTLRSIKDPGVSTYQWEIIARNGT